MNWGQEPEYNLIPFFILKKGEKNTHKMTFSGKTKKNMELDAEEKYSSWDMQK